MNFMEYLQRVRHQCEPTTPVRDLTPAELAVEKQALQVLGQYFSGEMDFGDRPLREAFPPGDDEEPPAPVKEPV
jgi:hypothetical protein